MASVSDVSTILQNSVDLFLTCIDLIPSSFVFWWTCIEKTLEMNKSLIACVHLGNSYVQEKNDLPSFFIKSNVCSLRVPTFSLNNINSYVNFSAVNICATSYRIILFQASTREIQGSESARHPWNSLNSLSLPICVSSFTWMTEHTWHFM